MRWQQIGREFPRVPVVRRSGGRTDEAVIWDRRREWDIKGGTVSRSSAAKGRRQASARRTWD